MMTAADTPTYADAATKIVDAARGISYAYRDVGSGAVLLVLLQHFRGNLAEVDEQSKDGSGN